jgi:hypothetical protein
MRMNRTSFAIVAAIGFCGASRGVAQADVGLYLTEAGASDYVFRVNSDGVTSNVIQAGVPGDPSVDPRGVGVDASASKAYFIRSTALQRKSLDGSGLLETVATGVKGPNVDVEIHNGRVYWSQVADLPLTTGAASTGIFSRALDLSDGVTPVLTQATLNGLVGLDPDVKVWDIKHLEIANDLIYWTNGSSTINFNSCSLAGGSPTNIFNRSGSQQFDIDVDAAKAYWSDGASKIERSDLAGTGAEAPLNLETVVDFGGGAPGSIAIDTITDTMYYTRSQKLWSLPTTGLGSAVQIYDFASTFFAPTDLEIGPAVPEPATTSLLAAAAMLGLRRRR